MNISKTFKTCFHASLLISTILLFSCTSEDTSNNSNPISSTPNLPEDSSFAKPSLQAICRYSMEEVQSLTSQAEASVTAMIQYRDTSNRNITKMGELEVQLKSILSEIKRDPNCVQQVIVIQKTFDWWADQVRGQLKSTYGN